MTIGIEILRRWATATPTAVSPRKNPVLVVIVVLPRAEGVMGAASATLAAMPRRASLPTSVSWPKVAASVRSDAGCDVGEPALVAGRAERHRVGRGRDRAGADRDRVRRRGGGAGAKRRGE